MGGAVPYFPVDFSTENATLFVLGSAPCLMTDLDVAKALRPNHRLMAINDVANWLPVDFIFSWHAEKMHLFRAMQQKFHDDFTTHADARSSSAKKHRSQVDHLWHDVYFGATSSIGGASVGLLMGFREVILCGAPMSGGDGYYQQPVGTTTPGTPRFGYTAPSKSIIKRHQEKLRGFVKIGRGLVFSMSGLTQQLLGAPPEVPCYGNINRAL
jgi:hypothetical protein